MDCVLSRDSNPPPPPNSKVMKLSPQPSSRLTAIGLAVGLIALPTRTLHAAVTLDANDAFMLSGIPTGDLIVTGNLSVVNGIDFGTAAANPALTAVQINYFGGSANAAIFDLTDPLGVFRWRDNLAAGPRDKLALDGGNLLTLYKSDGTEVGILLNPNTGQIHLSGTGGGIYAGGNPVFTIGASGNLVFGNRPFSLTNATASSSASTGALTVAGGLGVAMDSHINGIRLGRGAGNVSTNTAYGASALQSNTTGSCNTASGYYSLSRNTTGYYNTAAGVFSLYVNTSGSANTATGSYSLYANTTGGSNTAAGCYALSRNTTGYYNTAAGVFSLYVNTSGSANTATGAYSLYANTTGGSNTAAGSYSLSRNTTGYSNTAAGAFSLYNNTAGSSNTADGSYSLYGNTTGFSNAAYGYYTLGRNTTGYYNTAAGPYALGCNSSGNANTAAGYFALQCNTTGTANVAIGSCAGRYQANGTSSLTDPDNSIYLGANSRGFSNLDQNSIVIGAAAIGEGANTTVIGNSSTTKTHLYGELATGKATLTNKQWQANPDTPLVDLDAATSSSGEALVVEGHTRLKGKVIIEQAQGDISMGIYGP